DGDDEATGGTPANALVYDARPPAPTGLTAAQSGRSTFTVTFATVNAYDLDFYRLYWSTSSDFSPYYIVDLDSAAAGATLSTQVAVNQSSGTFWFRVGAWDKGLPTFSGIALESVYASTISADLVQRLPQAPYGVALTTSGADMTLRWMPVVRYADGASFADPQNPTADELTGYRVYGALSPVATYYLYASPAIGASTHSWTGPSTASWSYYVRAESAGGQSRPSVVREVASRSAWVVSPESTATVKSSFEVRAPFVKPVEGVEGDPMSAYLIEASSRPHELGGRIVQSIFFGAWKGGELLDPYLAIDGLGRLKIWYNTDNNGLVATPAGVAPLSGVANTPNNLAVYWFNGSRWIQLYGEVDEATQTMSIETKYFGAYQLRTVERTTGFNFNQAGVSNRLVTPNGDGKNDAVVFTYDNPRDSEVTVRILDVRGKVVAGSLPAGPASNSKQWAPPSTIPGGVYIYQIESEGRVFTGTIVIIR
ncbi:MAG: T9SS type A sorting domain-containing protein, partial [Elusimicrobiota bacterium]|nr:T9SS type A sorting domain-containing protein [Elusimicrobiota bacterium]